jgi:hypothetical protein
MIFLALAAACSGAVGPAPSPEDDTTPATEDTSAALPAPEEVGVVFNELLSANDGVVLDDQGDADDFVELWNGQDVAVDVSDWTLSLDGQRWSFPKDTVIGPRAWLLLWCDGDGDDLHPDFTLPREGGTLLLEDGSGVDQAMVEWGAETPLGEGATDIAVARVPDGVGPWRMTPPSPGASNPTP